MKVTYIKATDMDDLWTEGPLDPTAMLNHLQPPVKTNTTIDDIDDEFGNEDADLSILITIPIEEGDRPDTVDIDIHERLPLEGPRWYAIVDWPSWNKPWNVDRVESQQFDTPKEVLDYALKKVTAIQQWSSLPDESLGVRDYTLD
jgi:hypothetical protein